VIKIAHRGNTHGPSIYENQPSYIEKAINFGYDVEIDIWKIRDCLWLGHDSAQYKIDEDFLNKNKDRLWIHCKNLEAFDYLLNKDLNIFWHQEDDYTLTSKGYIWAYPGKLGTSNSVVVSFDKQLNPEYLSYYGVCSDYVGLWG